MPPSRPSFIPPDITTGDAARRSPRGSPPGMRGAGDSAPTRLPPAPDARGPGTSSMPPSFQPYAAPPTAQPIRFVRAPADAGRPYEERARAPRAYSGDYWGAFSLETFADVGGLTYTHDDASGWLAYLQQFQPANFWYQDANVKPWAYYEQYDNWLDTYGMDAVLAVYHSGHGGMDGAGVFSVPLGADWGGLGTWATSDRMRLGNEQANYIFFSTCESLRVLGGHNPIRTWSPANLGFRMLFGFETTSWDDPNYGKYFWEEWRGGQRSLSTAWLEASWRIAHDQAPSVVACGASAAEAQNRLYNEASLAWEHVSNAWWWWRWYSAASSAIAVREGVRSLPAQLLVAELAPTGVADGSAVRRVVERLALPVRMPSEIATARDGSFVVAEGSRRILFAPDGSFEAQLAAPNSFNRAQIDLAHAASIAGDAVRRFGLDDEGPLVFDRVRLSAEGGGTGDGSGRLEGPYIIGTTVQYRQSINGLPVITPDAGTVRVTVDNDGTVTSVQSSVRRVAALHDRPRNARAAPGEESALGRAPADDAGVERLLSDAWRKRLATWVVRGDVPAQYTIVPGSTEIGYDVRGNHALIVARRAVEVDFGRGIRKRYWVTAPIFG